MKIWMNALNGAPILKSEFKASYRDLKNKKAPRIDETPGELL